MSFRAYPIVPSELEIPEGLLPEGVDYHDGFTFETLAEAEEWADVTTQRFSAVSYVEIHHEES